MKNSIIKDIFYGNNKCWDNIKMSHTYFKLFDKFCDLLDEFTNSLNANQKELLEKLKDLDSDIDLESNETFFKEGFKLGLLIGIEGSENSNN